MSSSSDDLSLPPGFRFHPIDEELLSFYLNSHRREYKSDHDHPWIYDVFISFRGEDTRGNFVSHLYAALSNAGIYTFLDDKKLKKGKKLGTQLKRAIEGSRICIIVLSPKYAGSSWCLDELVHIMECQKTYGQEVIPLFYYVNPSFVRKQTGDFGKLLKLTGNQTISKARKNEGLMSKWREALNEVANLSGLDASNFRNEAELTKKLTGDILTKLDISLLSITKYPIGLISRVQKVTNFINDQSSNVCMIGIWGMGGSGKTTMAKAIYNKIHRRFGGRTTFIESIREVCDNNSKGIIHLQQQLLSDLLKIKQKIHSIASGITKIETRLRGQKAFVILDDVTKADQLENLCANPELFGSGSVLIITTRDLHLLKSLGADHVFTMTEMDEIQSLELFSWHAFRLPGPTEIFSELSKNVVAYCGGLPLALEVLGSYLYKRTKQEWISALSKLEKIPNDQVLQKLRISYDGLEDHTIKDIFLDICCFFIGKKRADVSEILNGCGLHADIGIAVLIDRSLLKVEKNNKLRMHDLLRDMGRAIFGESSPKEPAKHSRLCFPEDVLEVLSNETAAPRTSMMTFYSNTSTMGTETVEGLNLKLERTARIRFGTKAFREMKKLRLLKLNGVHLTGDYGLISNQLRWLLEKLKVLNFSHSKYLRSTPDFSKLPNLEKLIMKDCPSLSEVHSSVGDLKNLLLINLRDCTSLENLPREVYRLISVKTLILSGCSKIDKLEEDILQMESLTTLIATNSGLKQVPYSIVRSKSIAYISLCGYEGLSRDIFPSLIKSWMSPTINSLPHVSPFAGNSLSRFSLDMVESNTMGYQSPMPNILTKLRSVWVQCHSENQLNQESRRFLDDLYDLNFVELETTSHGPLISNLCLRSLVIGMGSSQIVMDTLGKRLSQGLSTNDSSASFLPGDNYPSWLAYKCKGPSVHFKVAENSTDRCIKGMTSCVLYSSTTENLANECLTSVLIINHTKFTIQIYRRDTVMSFNDEDWRGVVSNLGVGDNVEIFVAIGHGLTVKETAVYLIYDPSTNTKMEPEPSPDAKTEPSPEKWRIGIP
ncbi:hypothetical protein TSUD_354840 [Trifolium subterraneum]|uniref:TIR domain-containing protein n=1 Tax=Trifolium subterraneum TaxID=3900 RepID=A0A2Z6NGA2_TRISU|nr:hypothetical protein TSUD_354840 [Trifolium subterraneum]